jgi:hypothetical protein
MILTKYTLPVFLALFAFFVNSYAQDKEPFRQSERVYLHTDRNIYLAGDNLFYALYLQGNSNRMSKFAYILLRDSHNAIITTARLEIVKEKAFGNLSLADTLTSGIYQIVCFTNRMRNAGEETFFTKEIVVANRFDEELNTIKNTFSASLSGHPTVKTVEADPGIGKLIIHLDRQNYLPREKISFSVESANVPDNTVLKLSISIREMVPDLPAETTVSDYFGNAGTGTCDAPGPYYQEAEGPVLQGKIIPAREPDTSPSVMDRTVENSQNLFTVMVSTPDSLANMQYTTTDSTGAFAFLLNRYYDGKELIIRLKNPGNQIIQTDNRFVLSTPFQPSGYFNVHSLGPYLLRCQSIARVNRTYTKTQPIQAVRVFLPARTIPRIYYKPYYVVHPADFLELPDFVEISRELIPAFKVRKEGDHYISNEINLQDQLYFDGEPSIFLDGVPIDDVNEIISLGSRQISRIETLPVTRYYRDMSFSGILAVFTRDHFINSIRFNTPSIRYPAQASSPFTKPDLFESNNDNPHIPDMRQLLLWIPDVELKKNEKREIVFYASDLRGKFSINIQGITAEGDPVSASAIINIEGR